MTMTFGRDKVTSLLYLTSIQKFRNELQYRSNPLKDMLITDIQHIRKSKIKTQMSDRKRAISERTEGKKEEVDKGCEFNLCQASGAFKQKIKGAASKMSFTLFKTLLHSGRNLPLRSPYTKGTTSDRLHYSHNIGSYRIRALKLVQRLAKMTC